MGTGHFFRAIAWQEGKINVQLQRGGAKGPKKEIVRNKISSKSCLHWGGRPGGHWRPRGGGRPEDRHWGGDPIEQRGGSFTRGGQSGAWCSGESERTPRRLRRQRWPEMSYIGRRGFKGPPGTASLHTITNEIHNQLTSYVLSDKFVIS